MTATQRVVINASDIQLSPVIRTASETTARLLEAATEITSASTQAYTSGLHAMLEHQQLVQQASVDWMTDLIGAHSNARKRLADSYSSVQGELIDAAEQPVRRVGQQAAEMIKTGSGASTSQRDQEPVAGYDELNVPDVQALLSKGDEHLAVRVRDYEHAHKNRDGVLQAADARLTKS